MDAALKADLAGAGKLLASRSRTALRKQKGSASASKLPAADDGENTTEYFNLTNDSAASIHQERDDARAELDDLVVTMARERDELNQQISAAEAARDEAKKEKIANAYVFF